MVEWFEGRLWGLVWMVLVEWVVGRKLCNVFWIRSEVFFREVFGFFFSY